MTVELHADDRALELDRESGTEPMRPNLSGDLPTLFESAPMFRRALAGYDRFQVDTYAQWAENEIATAERERRRLLARYLSTQAALEEARSLLSHSSGGGQFVQVSERIGAMLAGATDEAEAIRAEAEAIRTATEARAAELVADAERSLAEARTTAEQILDDGADEARRTVTEATAAAEQILDEARRAAAQLHAEAEARLAQVRADEQRAAEQIEHLRQQAERETLAARVQARADAVHLLDVGRDLRLRAEAETAARRDWLLAEVEALELRRAALQSELAPPVEAVPEPASGHRPDQRGGRFSR